jgi:APA family basic amino acid/polyamine antiporter
MCSGRWGLANFSNFFYSQAKTELGIPAWIIGLGFLITPFFGFETVPQMIEEGDFPLKDSTKAIWGSVVTCGIVYAFFFLGIGGMPVQHLIQPGGAATGGFLAISMMEEMGGSWPFWSVIFGIAAILCAIGTCLLGFWLSTVRLLYAMGKMNFLPASFAKLNRHQQPIIPNVLLLVISIVFLILQNAGTFMNDFFNLMAFGCACAYAITMVSAIRIHRQHPEWATYHLKGGNVTRYASLIIAIVVAFFCTLGQGIGSWISFGIYMGVGIILWLWMVNVNWRKAKVKITTPDGEKDF